MNLDRLRMQLLQHEGLRLKPYLDTVKKTTIGVGRNLTDRGITEREAMILLDNDIAIVVEELNGRFPWFKTLGDVRQRVLADMAFNLGIGGLLKFTNTLAAIQEARYDEAAGRMLQSLWATQVKGRAKRLSEMMRTGKDQT